MSAARITEIHVEGLRTLADVKLELDGLTVLIGENGSGKSSLIEVCELLRRLPHADFLSEFYNPHGGMFALLRENAPRLRLAATIEWLEMTCVYKLALAPRGNGAAIDEEQLEFVTADRSAKNYFRRQQDRVDVATESEPVSLPIAPTQLVLAGLPGRELPFMVHLARGAFRSIDVQLPFETLPSWAARAFNRKSEARGSVLLAPADRLDTLGTNLANVYYALREQSDRAYWDDTMDLLRLGLGIEFEEVRSSVDMGGGAHALAIKWRGRDRLMHASALSDGQIAFLSFVALYRLKRDRSLLAFDEPELHLHPGLIARVAQMFEALGEKHPVLIATHSDRFLDALTDPVKSVRVCDLEAGATRLRRLDRAALDTWLTDYRGVGQLRSDGHLPDVLEDP